MTERTSQSYDSTHVISWDIVAKSSLGNSWKFGGSAWGGRTEGEKGGQQRCGTIESAVHTAISSGELASVDGRSVAP